MLGGPDHRRERPRWELAAHPGAFLSALYWPRWSSQPPSSVETGVVSAGMAPVCAMLGPSERESGPDRACPASPPAPDIPSRGRCAGPSRPCWWRRPMAEAPHTPHRPSDPWYTAPTAVCGPAGAPCPVCQLCQHPARGGTRPRVRHEIAPEGPISSQKRPMLASLAGCWARDAPARRERAGPLGPRGAAKPRGARASTWPGPDRTSPGRASTRPGTRDRPPRDPRRQRPDTGAKSRHFGPKIGAKSGHFGPVSTPF